jgi:hypothetical protein
MKTSISISDFSFEFQGRGAYNVTYTSPVTGKMFTNRTTDMPLIDATKNADDPKKCDLEQLKRICKS